MPGYDQYHPVALGAEIFAERWTPFILRELLAKDRRFSQLHRSLPRMSSNLLARRLKRLERIGIVGRRRVGKGRWREYSLTDAGRELAPVIQALCDWADKLTANEMPRGRAD
jgi:DNA-binding HxlR family transcriptional regulator